YHFFFQAEDGIRDRNVTGVQTCALPISTSACEGRHDRRRYADYRRTSVFLERRRRTATLALDGAGGETRDVVLHEEGIDEGDGNRAQQRPGHQLTPVEGVPSDQLAHDADRHGSHARTVEKEQRVEELVLRQREGEDAGGNE